MTTRNLAILVAAQCVAVAGSVLVITVGGIVGVQLAPAAWLATLPVSLMVVGTALATVPAASIMRRVGRRAGFAGAAVGGALGALLGGAALAQESFALFCAAALLIGAQVAFSQQYRFAAAESTAPHLAGRAISIVLVGAMGGALLGPEIAARAAVPFAGVPWLGGFLAIAALGLFAAVLLGLLVEPAPSGAAADATAARALPALLRQRTFVIAVLAGVVGQGTMTLIMTATPVSMHVVDGHAMAETSAVIRAHVLAMYVPSLISAALIGWLGVVRLMSVGLLALGATLVVAFQGHAVLHYWWALVLLGVGWNFLFVGGTGLLIESYLPSERFKAQALNDFTVFGVSALASLLAGSIVVRFGWTAVLWGSMPLLAVLAVALVLLVVGRTQADVRASAPADQPTSQNGA